jgi:hypothetical protein
MVVTAPLSLLAVARHVAFDDGLQAVTIIIVKRGELEGLAVPGHRSEHLGFSGNAAFVGEKHQLAHSSRLYRTLQTEQPPGNGNDPKLCGAVDAPGEAHHHRGFLIEPDTLGTLAELGLWRERHVQSMTEDSVEAQITEGSQGGVNRPMPKKPGRKANLSCDSER